MMWPTHTTTELPCAVQMSYSPTTAVAFVAIWALYLWGNGRWRGRALNRFIRKATGDGGSRNYSWDRKGRSHCEDSRTQQRPKYSHYSHDRRAELTIREVC